MKFQSRPRLTYSDRPHITPLHAFKSGSSVCNTYNEYTVMLLGYSLIRTTIVITLQAIGSRIVVPSARSWPPNVSKRLLSEVPQPENITRDSNATKTHKFDDKDAQLAYRAALRSGNVVIKTASKNEAAPFWQLWVHSY